MIVALCWIERRTVLLWPGKLRMISTKIWYLITGKRTLIISERRMRKDLPAKKRWHPRERQTGHKRWSRANLYQRTDPR